MTLSSHCRRLCKQDSFWFDNGLANSNVILVFPLQSCALCWFGITRSDSKLKLAFQHVVKNNPMLQAKIVGDGENAVFKRMLTIDAEDPLDAFPALVIEPNVEDSEEAMIAWAKSILIAQKKSAALGGKDALRYPIKLTAVKGPHDIAFIIVFPHHYFDGGGIGSIVAQFYMKQLLPQNAKHHHDHDCDYDSYCQVTSSR